MPSWKRYVYALAIFTLVATLKLVFHPVLTEDTPLIFLSLVVIVCAWFFDIGPGIMVTILCSIFALYLLTSEYLLEEITDYIRLVIGVLSFTVYLLMVYYIRDAGNSRKSWSDSQRDTINAFEKLEEGIFFAFKDDGVIHSFNKGAEKTLLYRKDEIVDTHWNRLFTGEDIRSGMPDQILKIAREKGSWHGEIWHARKNGSRIWCDVTVVRLRTGYYYIAHDTTRQKSDHEALERWRRIFEHGGWAVAVVDAQSNTFTHVNKAYANLHGHTPEELTNKPLTFVFSTEFQHELPQHIQKANMNDYSYESVHIRKNGQRFPCLTHVCVFKDDHGRPLYRVGICEDVTEQRKLERDARSANDELRAISEQKDTFLATLAHELRNPLQPIKMMLHVHSQGGIADGKMLELFNRNIDQIQRLVDDLMDVARIAKGKVVLQKTVAMDIRDVLHVALEQSSPNLRAKGHKLYNSLPTEPVYIDADPARLQQIFVNLLNNAAKYTDEGGNISISTSVDGDHVSIRIKDDGIGIEKDILPKVFDLYTQADPALHRAQGGLGLGLTLVKKLVELHGGQVFAYSEGPGKGSTFSVVLPLSQTKPEAIILNSRIFTGELHDKKVLVVDDNVDAAQSMEMMLTMDGCEVAVAYDGEEGAKVFDIFQPEIAILDIGLPKMDGYEVARQIRAKSSDVILIAVTGYGQPSDIAQSKEAGFDLHLVKPVEPNHFKKMIQSTLKTRQIGQQHAGLYNQTL
jgi:PAS domain S-box-containing protein